MSLVTLSVCMRCRAPDWTGDDELRPGALLAVRITEELATKPPADPLALRTIRCMSQCKRPCVVAFSSERRFTYVFGDLDPSRDVAAVSDALRLYQSKPDGFMERPERPEVMRAGVLGRIPPLGSAHETVDAVVVMGPSTTLVRL